MSGAERTLELILKDSGVLGFFNVSQRELKKKVSIFLINITFTAVFLITHNKVSIAFFVFTL